MNWSIPGMKERLRGAMRRGRSDGARWVDAFDLVRDAGSAAGRARLWVKLVHRGEAHQSTEYTAPERYAELFDFVAQSRPDARRILSFGCSTGEEISAIRRRFPDAYVLGAEINPRSRAAARRTHRADAKVRIATSIAGERPFDIIFAMAVLQFQPKRIERDGVTDLSKMYPYERFDRGLTHLCGALARGGLLCVMHAHYRVEDASCSALLARVPGAPVRQDQLFDRRSRLLEPAPPAGSLFTKVG